MSRHVWIAPSTRALEVIGVGYRLALGRVRKEVHELETTLSWLEWMFIAVLFGAAVFIVT